MDAYAESTGLEFEVVDEDGFFEDGSDNGSGSDDDCCRGCREELMLGIPGGFSTLRANARRKLSNSRFLLAGRP